MFYSHEILSNRKYGVATIWLVATLGQRTGVRKINRKAILSVNVPKACETIITPEAPLALRLQSNLLYGISRVYYQQCDYVLVDAQSARNTIHQILNAARTTRLDAHNNVHQRPQDLLLQESYSNLPDFELPLLDIESDVDRGITAWAQDEESLHTSQEYSKHQGEITFPSESSIPGLIDFNDDHEDSGLGIHARTSGYDYDEQAAVTPRNDLVVDDDGNLVELPVTPLAHTTARPRRLHSDSSVEASARQLQVEAGFPTSDHDNHLPIQDALEATLAYEHNIAISSDPMAHFDGTFEQSIMLEDQVEQQKSVPLRRLRARRPIPMDQFRRSTLSGNAQRQFQSEYPVLMTKARKDHMARQMTYQAKKNAEHFILGLGVNEVGKFGHPTVINPHADFQGNDLYQLIVGREYSVVPRKRRSEDYSSDSERRVRGRQDEVGTHGDHTELLDGGLNNVPEDIEMPRTGGPGVNDVEEPSSTMPWNVAASARGSSFPPHSVVTSGGALNTTRNRFFDASPLHGRGIPFVMSDALNYQDHDTMNLDLPQSYLSSEPGFEEEARDQIVNYIGAILDKDSRNFLDFFQETLFKAQEAQDQRAEQLKGTAEALNELDFETLLPQDISSRAIAAAGFMHVLTLVTKNLLKAKQDRSHSDYSAIWLRL